METTLGEPIDAEPTVSIDPNRLAGSVYAKYQGFLAFFGRFSTAAGLTTYGANR
jgi:hypothetical protein